MSLLITNLVLSDFFYYDLIEWLFINLFYLRLFDRLIFLQTILFGELTILLCELKLLLDGLTLLIDVLKVLLVILTFLLGGLTLLLVRLTLLDRLKILLYKLALIFSFKKHSVISF